MKNPPNVFDFDKVSKLIDIYKTIDKAKGPGVCVTVSTSPKIFSAGFDLNYWMKDANINPLVSSNKLHELLSTIITLHMPSLCLINGHAYGGGLILSLCHTYRAMVEDKAKLCLSEINLGFTLGPALTVLCKDKMPINSFREMLLGIAYKGPRAKEMGVV